MTTLVLKPIILALDLWFKQGADAKILLTVVDANGAAIVDPTGYGARAQIRSAPSGLVLFEWNTSSGAGLGTAVITYNAQALKSVLTLGTSGAQSALFTFGTAQWDCFLTDPAGEAACIAEGTVTIDPRYTH